VDTPPQFYKIQDLVLLPELNPRAQMCEETIIRYMESFNALPPVNIQEGTGVLVDGFHRVEAATRLGAEVIPVHMLDIPDEELHLYAGLANAHHGRSLSRAERNRFVVRLVTEYGWPMEKIARTVGVSASSVALALREHQYNHELSERLGEEVQVINSSHVQALFRVGDEQRARLLDAVAGKTDPEGRPQPLTGAELKLLVDRMEDPATPAEELGRLLEDPLARPEAPARRRAGSSGEKPGTAVDEGREVDRRGPLYEGRTRTDAEADLRSELLERAFAPSDDDLPRDRGAKERSRREEEDSRSVADPTRPLADTSTRPAPLGLDTAPSWEGEPEPTSPAVAVLERSAGERAATDALREAERLLCDLCASLEDGELWDQARSARDLVREALARL
jgi:ParB-like chromosome segregation protein Spo0J